MTCCGPALRDRHVQRGQDQARAQVRRHRPADDATTPHVEHDRQVQHSRRGRDVGDVGDPELVRAGRRETAAAPDPGAGRAVRGAHRRHRPLAPTDAPQAGLLEQPRDPLAADAHARRAQIAMNPRRAIRARATRRWKSRICSSSVASSRAARLAPPRAPRVVPAGGDAQHAAHGGEGMGGLMRLHEFEPFGGIEPVSRANQAAAFFRISRSSRSVAFSRRKRCSSVAFVGRQPVGASARIALRLRDPVPNGLRRRLELSGQ